MEFNKPPHSLETKVSSNPLFCPMFLFYLESWLFKVYALLFSGKTYLFRISNVGLSVSINFRIQNHQLQLVEVEGSHTIQNIYDSLDIHVGQSMTVLVTLDQAPKDYYIVASSRFTRKVLTSTAILHYSNSNSGVSGPVPAAPATGLHWSMRQARTFRYSMVLSMRFFDCVSCWNLELANAFVSFRNKDGI